MLLPDVRLEVVVPRLPQRTHGARERFLAGMSKDMPFQLRPFGEHFETNSTVMADMFPRCRVFARSSALWFLIIWWQRQYRGYHELEKKFNRSEMVHSIISLLNQQSVRII